MVPCPANRTRGRGPVYPNPPLVPLVSLSPMPRRCRRPLCSPLLLPPQVLLGIMYDPETVEEDPDVLDTPALYLQVAYVFPQVCRKRDVAL